MLKIFLTNNKNFFTFLSINCTRQTKNMNEYIFMISNIMIINLFISKDIYFYVVNVLKQIAICFKYWQLH